MEKLLGSSILAATAAVLIGSFFNEPTLGDIAAIVTLAAVAIGAPLVGLALVVST